MLCTAMYLYQEPNSLHPHTISNSLSDKLLHLHMWYTCSWYLDRCWFYVHTYREVKGQTQKLVWLRLSEFDSCWSSFFLNKRPHWYFGSDKLRGNGWIHFNSLITVWGPKWWDENIKTKLNKQGLHSSMLHLSVTFFLNCLWPHKNTFNVCHVSSLHLSLLLFLCFLLFLFLSLCVIPQSDLVHQAKSIATLREPEALRLSCGSVLSHTSKAQTHNYAMVL